jgi:hypothetical protein
MLAHTCLPEAELGGLIASAVGASSGAMCSAPSSVSGNSYLHTATLLPDGTVLVSGGFGSNGLLATAELYTP